jgi:hypothetical protein
VFRRRSTCLARWARWIFVTRCPKRDESPVDALKGVTGEVRVTVESELGPRPPDFISLSPPHLSRTDDHLSHCNVPRHVEYNQIALLRLPKIVVLTILGVLLLPRRIRHAGCGVTDQRLRVV